MKVTLHLGKTPLFGIIYPILCSYGVFLVMILCNCAIIYKFMMVKWRNRGSDTDSTSQALSKSTTTGTTMLITISFAYICLTAPIWVANIVWPNSTISVLNFKSLIAIQYLNHGMNGILYCVVGSRFRNELTCLMRCRTTHVQRLSTIRSTVIGSTSVRETTAVTDNS